MNPTLVEHSTEFSPSDLARMALLADARATRGRDGYTYEQYLSDREEAEFCVEAAQKQLGHGRDGAEENAI